jgi:hypothetical protein
MRKSFFDEKKLEALRRAERTPMYSPAPANVGPREREPTIYVLFVASENDREKKSSSRFTSRPSRRKQSPAARRNVDSVFTRTVTLDQSRF